jgi:hypothetical protein
LADVDNVMAMPSAIGVHSTIALTGQDFSPATSPTANQPGLNATNIFTDEEKRKPKMLTKHWLLIGLALVAIWYFFFRGSTASLSAAAA